MNAANKECRSACVVVHKLLWILRIFPDSPKIIARLGQATVHERMKESSMCATPWHDMLFSAIERGFYKLLSTFTDSRMTNTV